MDVHLVGEFPPGAVAGLWFRPLLVWDLVLCSSRDVGWLFRIVISERPVPRQLFGSACWAVGPFEIESLEGAMPGQRWFQVHRMVLSQERLVSVPVG